MWRKKKLTEIDIDACGMTVRRRKKKIYHRMNTHTELHTHTLFFAFVIKSICVFHSFFFFSFLYFFIAFCHLISFPLVCYAHKIYICSNVLSALSSLTQTHSSHTWTVNTYVVYVRRCVSVQIFRWPKMNEF